MSKLVVEYAPADVAETRHYKIAMKVPPKWLEPSRKTKVKKILDAFGKSYDAKFGAGALGTDELGLMEPRAQGKTFDADDLVVDDGGGKAGDVDALAGVEHGAVDGACASQLDCIPRARDLVDLSRCTLPRNAGSLT